MREGRHGYGLLGAPGGELGAAEGAGRDRGSSPPLGSNVSSFGTKSTSVFLDRGACIKWVCRGLQFGTNGNEARGQKRGEGGRYYLFLTNKINEGNETRLFSQLGFSYNVYSFFFIQWPVPVSRRGLLGLVMLDFVGVLTRTISQNCKKVRI